jgi:hypothetical protein
MSPLSSNALTKASTICSKLFARLFNITTPLRR